MIQKLTSITLSRTIELPVANCLLPVLERNLAGTNKYNTLPTSEWPIAHCFIELGIVFSAID